VLLSIQGEDVRQSPLKDVIVGIKTARRPLTLVFEKDAEHLDELSAVAVLKQVRALSSSFSALARQRYRSRSRSRGLTRSPSALATRVCLANAPIV